MARVLTLRKSLIPVLIITLFVFQSMTPLVTPDKEIEQTLEQKATLFSDSFVDQNNTFYGHDFAIDALRDVETETGSRVIPGGEGDWRDVDITWFDM